MFSGLDQRSTVLYIFIALSAFGTLFFLLLRSSNTNSRKKVGIIIPIFYRKLTMCVVWLYFCSVAKFYLSNLKPSSSELCVPITKIDFLKPVTDEQVFYDKVLCDKFFFARLYAQLWGEVISKIFFGHTKKIFPIHHIFS